ncbi:MAG: isopentenyl phosphate kinase family protein [Chloroflexota bacterium]
MPELVFLKLGGSLITDKTRPYTPRLDVLAHLAAQIAASNVRMVLGHGSGSFGHTAAKAYRTREGTPTPDPHRPIGHLPQIRTNPGPIFGEAGRRSYWHGFGEVWFQASALNRHVIEALHAAGVSTMTFPPSAGVTARDGRITAWELTPLRRALEAGLLPVIYGDVAFDEVRGGTILSTEELFLHLARELRPGRVLLAGLEEAVWADFPARRLRVRHVTPGSFDEIRRGVGQAAGADVTGGMESKVKEMLALAQEIPGLTAQIFSGEIPGNLAKVLQGEVLGTLISA